MSRELMFYNDLVIENLNVVTIENLKITQTLNAITKVEIIGFLPEEGGVDIYDISIDTPIKILKKEDVLFQGILTDIRKVCEQDVTKVFIECHSNSYIMNINKEKKSFQNKTMTYKNLIQEIVSEYDKALFMDKVTDGATINVPIFQYNETDWEFLVRVASHFNVTLIDNCQEDKIQFFVGLPEINKGKVKFTNRIEYKDCKWFRHCKNKLSDISERDYVYFVIETEDTYDLGDNVFLNDISVPLYVVETVYTYENGIIKNICKLSTKKGARVPRKANINIAGSSIFGTVLQVARDNIKVHLDIDATQNIGEAYWFPYASMYASENETGWYCMPEVGDSVRLYTPEQEESQAIAISSVKPHDPTEDVEALDPEHRMANPDVKYLRTAFGKELKFRPDGIDIIAKDNQVFATLNDDGVLYLNAEKSISMSAVENITMKAPKVNIEALNGITWKTPGSKVEMTTDIVIEGAKVKTN